MGSQVVSRNGRARSVRKVVVIQVPGRQKVGHSQWQDSVGSLWEGHYTQKILSSSVSCEKVGTARMSEGHHGW